MNFSDDEEDDRDELPQHNVGGQGLNHGDDYLFEIKDSVELAHAYFQIEEMNQLHDLWMSNGFVAHGKSVWRHQSDNFRLGRPDLLEEIPALATNGEGASCAAEKGKGMLEHEKIEELMCR